MTHPDFIIIGAMKCGTSTLAAQLGAQPGFFMTDPKEPNFFSDNDVFSKGQNWYSKLFDKAQASDLKGEASTHYTKLPTYPDTIARLYESGARPKLIYLLRDPIDRLVSHYIHEWTQGVIHEPIDEALAKYPELTTYSRYADQLAPWVETFGLDSILLLSMSMLKSDPHLTMEKVGAFLGRPELAWNDDLGQLNVSSQRIRRLPMQKLLVDNPIATGLRRTLVPKALRNRVKNARQMRSRPVISDANRARLANEFNQDREQLLDLFSCHQDLHALHPKTA